MYQVTVLRHIMKFGRTAEVVVKRAPNNHRTSLGATPQAAVTLPTNDQVLNPASRLASGCRASPKEFGVESQVVAKRLQTTRSGSTTKELQCVCHCTADTCIVSSAASSFGNLCSRKPLKEVVTEGRWIGVSWSQRLQEAWTHVVQRPPWQGHQFQSAVLQPSCKPVFASLGPCCN